VVQSKGGSGGGDVNGNGKGGQYTPSGLVVGGRLFLLSFGEDMLGDGEEVWAVWVAAAILWGGDVAVVSWRIACGTRALTSSLLSTTTRRVCCC